MITDCFVLFLIFLKYVGEKRYSKDLVLYLKLVK